MLSRFVARADSHREPNVTDAALIEDVRCLLQLRESGATRELVIATELGGAIRVLADRERLAQRARTQLAFHEVAARRALEIEASEIFVFDLQSIEMLPDAPGPNDPIYLYGAMSGPFPDRVGSPIAAVDGQLTVTRADLVCGLIDGVTNAFAYAPDAHGSRCVHALLPGERDDVIDAGRGIVLALPLAPGWLLDSPVANDLIAAQIFHDVLLAMGTDLGADTAALPVPNRAAYEQSLVATGWRIEGDHAVRAKGGGIIGSIFKGAERRQLPRQGTLDDLVAAARQVLSHLPDPPTPEVAALRRRSRRSAAVTVAHGRPAPTSPAPPIATPTPRVSTSRTEWMKDFIDAHRSPSRPAPRVSLPALAARGSAPPAWTRDFDPPAERSAPDSTGGEAAPPPDWSKDFD